MNNKFKLKSNFKPAGDQIKAIKELDDGIKASARHQMLLGVTGSGKTFTIANIIEKTQKPTVVLAHNKTLAAQLAQEDREFFPNAAVHYFVSYYDYYQPEAYLPITDTYIDKETQINEEIDRLRHAATQALLTRKDVIIVASVSAIYGLGNPVEYEKMNIKIENKTKITRTEIIRKLIGIYFERTNADLLPGKFRAIGNIVEIMPVNEKIIYRIELLGNKTAKLDKIDGISRAMLEKDIKSFFLFPAKHFVMPENERKRAIIDIKKELKKRLSELKTAGKILEYERLKRRTNYDLALIREIGYTNGIENYSRHFDGRKEGEAPYTLLSYFPRKKNGAADFLTIIDESHVTVPQLRGMYFGDRARKKILIEFGFRLPSAIDNRPLNFEEFEEKVGQTIYTSATPAQYEIEHSERITEQIIRPTGLIDPEIIVRPINSEVARPNKYGGQGADFIEEIKKTVKKGGRAIATTLTKKMAEDLSEYLKNKKIKTEYLHSGIKTMDRITILTDFRKGKFDVLVGVNLLREGLDLPEVVLIGILDADKEGFLRSETSLIQTIGRAARNADGRVLLYADKITGSMERAVSETNRRRTLQLEYNKKNGITPKTIVKRIKDITEEMQSEHQKTVKTLLEFDLKLFEKNPQKLIKDKEKQMNNAVKILDFESAAILRDEIRMLEKKLEKTTRENRKPAQGKN